MSYVNRSSGNGGQGGGQMVNIPNKRYNIPTADNGPGHRTRLLKVKRFSEAGFNQDSGISWRPRSKMLRSTVFGNGNRTNYPFSNVNMRNFAKLAEAGVMEPDGISSVSGKLTKGEQEGKNIHSVTTWGTANCFHTGLAQERFSMFDDVYVTVVDPDESDLSITKGSLGANSRQCSSIRDEFLVGFTYRHNPALSIDTPVRIKPASDTRYKGVNRLKRLQPKQVFRLGQCILGKSIGDRIVVLHKGQKAGLLNGSGISTPGSVNASAMEFTFSPRALVGDTRVVLPAPSSSGWASEGFWKNLQTAMAGPLKAKADEAPKEGEKKYDGEGY